ncbi:sll1863 family stress response protein [Bradyrhizobium diazoefficiens]|nr:BMFP domain-containing protein YqiC [Bradyrhizobium japonicum]
MIWQVRVSVLGIEALISSATLLDSRQERAWRSVLVGKLGRCHSNHGHEAMVTQNNINFFTNWAKERLDEMEATVTSLEARASEVQSEAREKATKVLADLCKQRDEFRDTVKKQSEVGEAAWTQAKSRMEADWRVFETEAGKYVESFGKQIEQQQATFKLQAEAQLKAWREAADKLGSDAKNFASERRGDIDAALKRMNADAIEAEKKLEKLREAGTHSWSALMAALAETRLAFDRANEAAREAFKRAA